MIKDLNENMNIRREDRRYRIIYEIFRVGNIIFILYNLYNI